VNHTVAIVPARLASTRLPGKALIDIAGKPMVCWVAERARAARNVDRVIVATDSQEIADAVQARGVEAVLTAAHHTSGTDRVAEVAAKIPDAEIIVNVQGDEPLISPATIERAVETMAAGISKHSGAGIVTTWEPIESLDDLLNPDLVKVVLDEDENAVYFSRSPVPYPRDAVKAMDHCRRRGRMNPSCPHCFASTPDSTFIAGMCCWSLLSGRSLSLKKLKHSSNCAHWPTA